VEAAGKSLEDVANPLSAVRDRMSEGTRGITPAAARAR
jgi:hypothetical protein